jgi:hypothetical protein
LARLWRGVAPPLRGRPAHRVLLALRLVNVLLFSLAVAAASVLSVSLVSEPFPQWLVYPFLFVPSLPFFAMHVSESATLCALYVLLGTSLAVLCLDGPRADWAGLPLGLATGLMLGAGRSPWPLAPLVVAALVCRAALGSRQTGGAGRAALRFWAGFALGAAVFPLVLDDSYRRMTEGYASNYTGFLPPGLRDLGAWLLAHPFAAALLAPGAAAALETAIAPLRARLVARFAEVLRRVAARTASALALLVVVSLVGSLFVGYPQLPLEPTHVLTPGERVGLVLATMATMFRLTEPNFLLASTFWVGFGWLDTMPGSTFQGLVVALAGIAVAALLRHVGRRRQLRRFVWLLSIAAGGAAALVLYTLSTQGLVTALHGRYLIGWYLAVLGVIGGALVLDHRASPAWGDPAGPSGPLRAAWLLVIAGAVHLYCLCFVLQRYF